MNIVLKFLFQNHLAVILAIMLICLLTFSVSKFLKKAFDYLFFNRDPLTQMVLILIEAFILFAFLCIGTYLIYN